MDRQVYIVSGCRTGIGSFHGQFSNVPAFQLGATVIENALRRSTIPPERVSAVVMGHVLTAGLGMNPARQASLAAKIPSTVPASSVNMVCGSSLKAVYDSYMMIRVGDCDVVIAGGQENMTLTKHAVSVRDATKLGSIEVKDCILTDGLTDPYINSHMGDTAEHLATKYSVSRETQDQYAYDSHAKASHAIANNYFDEEKVDVVIPGKDPVRNDEHVRPNTSVERLSKLRPAFSRTEGASVTAGNSSGINDGAAAVVLCSGAEVKNGDLKPLARIVGFSQVGLEPIEMGLGPVEAIKAVVQKAQWSLNDVDLFEINEAFAVQSVLVIQQLGIAAEKVNVSGGAIALGHPIGASGARILVTLCYNMKRLGKSKGVAALCIGGGMGIAVAIEAV